MSRSKKDILDEWLVLRSQEGSSEAFGRLVERWQPRLFRHAMRLVERQDAARDVLQDSWFSIVRGIKRLHDPASFRTWAYRIVSRRAADWVRKQQSSRRLTEKLEDHARRHHVDAHSSDATSSDVTRLRAVLQTLPPRHRIVLTMHYVDGLSTNEIGAALEVPTGTVKSRLHNARNTLREALERTQR